MSKLKIISWCPDVEESALVQIDNLANHPVLEKWIAVMPDCHCGYGMPIGCVIAAKNAVIPNAVGVDIGCGVCAVRTTLCVDNLTKDMLLSIMGKIRELVPVGMTHFKREAYVMPKRRHKLDVIDVEFENAKYQLGTLGGGNHFIEIQCDEYKNVWFMIHTGSRNLGYKVAKHYNKLAEHLNNVWMHNELVKQGLAFLPLYSKESICYLNEMDYCIEFSKLNRDIIANSVKIAMLSVDDTVSFFDVIDVPHNYACIEHHDEDNLMIHRKGAIRARKGELCIIPGSQGTASYIVCGLGNEKSFYSCSHGAGRSLSRTKAKEVLILENEIKKLNDIGVVHSIRNKIDLDEAPSAYKDIDIVMENQKDLVEISVKLKPLAVIKG